MTIFAVLRLRLTSVAIALAVLCALAGFSSNARAYPGPTNLNGNSGAGYISTAIVGLQGNCGGCHFGTANPPTNLSINGAGLGTFLLENDQTGSFTFSYDIGDSSRPYGGFLIAHNDGTQNDAGGTLGIGGDGYEHACAPSDGFPCFGTSNGNTEIMHAAPRPNSGGTVSFPFTYLPVAGSCGSFGFNVWVNNVNGDSMCNDSLDVPTESSFAIQVTCPPSNNQCATTSCNTSTGQCQTQLLTGTGCDDAQACTFNDTCTAGSCAGTPIACTSDACNTRACNGTASCTVTSLTGNGCDDGQSCTNNDTCSSGTCVGTPTMTCPTGRPLGSPCTDATQCQSNECVDGVCCNSACGGQCQACNSSGVCSPVTGQPVAPRGACAGDGTACSGRCNGTTTATCTFASTATACRAPSCTNDVGTLAANCDGKGSCPAPSTQNCTPYVCGPTACDTACTANVQCDPGLYCSGGKCVPLVVKGKGCSSDGQCVTGFCVDKVCCDGRCSGQCEACNVTGTPGVCSPVVKAAPHAPRIGCSTDGSACGGTCDGTTRDACVYPGPSVSCRPASCTEGVAVVGGACDGTGSCPAREQVICAKSCTGTQCGTECATSEQCNQGQFCQAGQCMPQFQNGDPCTSPGECLSSFCVDGVCCDAACNGQCQACDSANNAGSCVAVTGSPHGKRPGCAGAGQSCGGKCDGKNQTACTYPAETKVCAAGKCVGDVATLPRVCSGEGTCGPVQQQLCSPYSCGATQCAGNCTTDANCPSSDYCSAGVCTPKNPLGAPCAAPDQCSNGFCVDGLCCNQACDGQCQACDDPHATGECTTISGPPHGGRTPCGGAGLCAGTCDGRNASACHFPDATATCGTPACTNGIVASAPTCNGVGNCIASSAPTDCYPFGCGADGRSCADTCVTNDECAAGLVCQGGSCFIVQSDGGLTRPDAGAGGHPSTTPDSGAGGATSRMDASVSGGPSAGGASGTPSDGGITIDAGSSGKHGGNGSTSSGSCGCRAAGDTSRDGRAAWAALAAVSLLSRRRRQAARLRRV